MQLNEEDQFKMNIFKIKPFMNFTTKNQVYNFTKQMKRAKEDNLLKTFFNIIIKLIDDKPLTIIDSEDTKLLKLENENLKLENKKLKEEMQTYSRTRISNKRLIEKNEILEDKLHDSKLKIIELSNRPTPSTSKNNDTSIFDFNDNIDNVDIEDGYDPYSNDNIEYVESFTLSDCTKYQIQDAKTMHYDIWDDLTDNEKVEKIYENK